MDIAVAAFASSVKVIETAITSFQLFHVAIWRPSVDLESRIRVWSLVRELGGGGGEVMVIL